MFTLKHLIVVVLMVLSLTPVASANDASYFGRGASVFAYKENRIKMVSEHIKIRRTRNKSATGHGWTADCTFVFENTEDVPVTIQMGFPDDTAHPSGAFTIGNFKVWVRNVPVLATHKIVTQPSSPPILDLLSSKSDAPKKTQKPPTDDPKLTQWTSRAKAAMKAMDLGFAAAYTWDVQFKPGERIVVKNTYTFGGAYTMGPYTTCFEFTEKNDEKTKWYGEALWNPEFGLGPCQIIPYIVTTGKTWRGAIGEATIEMELPKNISPVSIIPMPKASRVTDNKVIWQYTNFRPTQDIHLIVTAPMLIDDDWTCSVHFTNEQVLTNWLNFAKLNGFLPSVIKRTYDIHRYAIGLRTNGQAAPKVFNDWCQPLAKKPRAESELTPVEKRVLKRFRDAIQKPH